MRLKLNFKIILRKHPCRGGPSGPGGRERSARLRGALMKMFPCGRGRRAEEDGCAVHAPPFWEAPLRACMSLVYGDEIPPLQRQGVFHDAADRGRGGGPSGTSSFHEGIPLLCLRTPPRWAQLQNFATKSTAQGTRFPSSGLSGLEFARDEVDLGGGVTGGGGLSRVDLLEVALEGLDELRVA